MAMANKSISFSEGFSHTIDFCIKSFKLTCKIPRPPNSFIIYSIYERPKLKLLCPQLSHNEISKLLGQNWNKLSLEERDSYKNKAKELKMEHAVKYPNYKFSRRLPGEIKRRNTRKTRC